MNFFLFVILSVNWFLCPSLTRLIFYFLFINDRVKISGCVPINRYMIYLCIYCDIIITGATDCDGAGFSASVNPVIPSAKPKAIWCWGSLLSIENIRLSIAIFKRSIGTSLNLVRSNQRRYFSLCFKILFISSVYYLFFVLWLSFLTC